MKFNLSIAVLISAALLVFGCAPAAEEPATEAPTQAEDVAAINALADEFVAASNAGDSAAAAALFAEDAIGMPSNALAVLGRQAIQSRLQQLFNLADLQVAMPREEVEAAGDWAFARGTYAETMTPKAGGEAREGNGKYLTILKRAPDGSWRIYRHMLNSDNPVSGTAE